MIDPFVRINPGGGDNCEHGFNTSHRKLEFDENNSATFTHDLALADVPVVSKGGTDYYQFLLDINQNNKGETDHFLSLNKIEIYSSGFAGASGYPGGLGALQWSLDGAGPAWVWLDYALNSGSGSGDMFLYVPKSVLSGTYIYFYSRFGEDYNANDGFEEMSHPARRTGSFAVSFCRHRHRRRGRPRALVSKRNPSVVAPRGSWLHGRSRPRSP